MPDLSDINLAHPLTNWNAWDANPWPGTFALAPEGDPFVGYGAMLLGHGIDPAAHSLLAHVGSIPPRSAPVEPGEQVTAGVLFYVLETHASSLARLHASLYFYDAADALLTYHEGNYVGAANGDLERSVVTGVAPAGAARVGLWILATPTTVAGTYLTAYAAQPQLHIGTAKLPRYHSDQLPADYDVQLGPLAFTWPSGAVEETLGDTLEAVGSALTPAGRRPRPITFPVRIEGASEEEDATAAGHRLRRQVGQLLDNRGWLAQGLYLWWRADAVLAGWVRIGGGKISETDPGVTFGIHDLELETPYLVGRVTSDRPGRRLDLADRRTGTVPRDTRGTLYSDDFATHPLPTHPLVVPGDSSGHVGTVPRAAGLTGGNIIAGPIRAGRRLFQHVAAVDGEVVAYSPHPGALPNLAAAPALLDEPGSVRVWDRTGSDGERPSTLRGDLYPDIIHGWERVYGRRINAPSAPLALENGEIRLQWTGGNPAMYASIEVEWWDAATGRYRLEGIVGTGQIGLTWDATVVEVTPERAVLEWRSGSRAIRAILQRGWRHFRVESYNDDLGATGLFYWTSMTSGTVGGAGAAPADWVRTLTVAGRTMYFAPGTADDGFVAGADVSVFAAAAGVSPCVTQIGSPASSAAEVAAASLCDARSVPVLVGRA